MKSWWTRWWLDSSSSNFVDYLLSWLGSCLAVISCGQAVGSNLVSWVGVLFCTIAMLLSFLVRSVVRSQKILAADGILYSLVSWAAFLVARPINAAVFPPDTFPIELAPSSWLFWMTILGCLFLWRDGTLLFQSIPALAMFGFVGCYDTFRPVVFLFFVFLICFALIFARAHARDMQKRAVESGYFVQVQQIHLSGEEQAEMLRKGPWRWAAGAEWALGSALVIVILSLAGAPVIQATAKPISGVIALRSPRLRNATTGALGTPQNSERANVGNGPVRLRAIPQFEVSGDTGMYYRTNAYADWDGRTWRKNWFQDTNPNTKATGMTPSGPPARPRIPNEYTKFNAQTLKPEGDLGTEELSKVRFPNLKDGEFLDEFRSKSLNIRSLVMTDELPQLGNAPIMTSVRTFSTDPAGVINLANSELYSAVIQYDVVPRPTNKSETPTFVNWVLSKCLVTGSSDSRTKSLGLQLKEEGGSPLEVAERIRSRVSQEIVYNTNVERTPSDVDAAAYAMFTAHEGYCDVFATNMVLMARAAGIPARYCVGYLCESESVRGVQTLMENDRHAWAELYFSNIGWVVFDATAGARTKEGGGRKDVPKDFKDYIKSIGILLNVLIVLFSAFAVVLYFRLKNAPRSAEALKSDLAKLYIRYCEKIRKATGKRRLLHESNSDYLNRVVSEEMPEAGELREIGSKFDRLFFGPDAINGDTLKGLEQRVDTLRIDSKRN